MLTINNLIASAADTSILHGVDLSIQPGELHVIMGPNGSGKSTLASVLAGSPEYAATGGSVDFDGQNLLEMSADERARAGIFLSFQDPVEIPGLSLVNMLKAAVNARRDEDLPAPEMMKLLREKVEMLGMSTDVLKRSVNDGMSGGEKKKSELLQLAALEPKLAILDEIDSGLDVDAVKVVADAIQKLRTPERSFLVITHLDRLLGELTPDHVHVFLGGKIVKSGGPELAKEILANGYEQFEMKT